MPDVTRRSLLLGAAGGTVTFGALATLGACTPAGTAVAATSEAVRRTEQARRRPGQRTVAARLLAAPATVDLGGAAVRTWAYSDTVPGPLLRATAGDVVRITVENELPAATSVHWHGNALRNDMDGVPGMTQAAIPAGERFVYEFTAPDAGTYFYHPHSGLQPDRGLYGVLMIDDPAEPGDYDAEWVVVLDDWLDGLGGTPEDALADLRQGGASGMGGMGGMGGMHDMGGMPGMEGMSEQMFSPLLGGSGDIAYPKYLVNGRTASAPAVLQGRPGQRVRLRIVNAGSDTAFRLALGGHTLTVTHADGYPVEAVSTDALLIGMGERYDALVTLTDGVFPLVASAEGKGGQGLAVVRTGSGAAPAVTVSPNELTGVVTQGAHLAATPEVRLAHRSVDVVHDLVLGGSMRGYTWTINGKTFGEAEPLPVHGGQRVRLRFRNATMMFHPMHVHGHTFGLVQGGSRRDTAIVRPMQSLEVDLDADNPGQWATHCHNLYHAERGMMTTLSYRQ